MTNYQNVRFDPIKTGFRWTESDDCGGMGWYEYDSSAEKKALTDRNKFAREQRKAGKTVKCSTNRSLRRMGGIGSGHPDIELIVPIYHAVVIG